jgi:hypothetical protein
VEEEEEEEEENRSISARGKMEEKESSAHRSTEELCEGSKRSRLSDESHVVLELGLHGKEGVLHRRSDSDSKEDLVADDIGGLGGRGDLVEEKEGQRWKRRENRY